MRYKRTYVLNYVLKNNTTSLDECINTKKVLLIITSIASTTNYNLIKKEGVHKNVTQGCN